VNCQHICLRGDILLLNDGNYIRHVLIVVKVHASSGNQFCVSFQEAPFFKKIAYTPPSENGLQQIKSLPPVSNLINSLPTNNLYYTVLALIVKGSWDLACSKDVGGKAGNSCTHSCSHCYQPGNQNLVPQSHAKVTRRMLHLFPSLD